MPDDRHNGAFVVGAILGGITGAAVTLWKTPQSGAELRAQVSQEVNELTGSDQHGQPRLQSSAPGSASLERLSSRALAFVERATAPLVGVKLGQTANDSGPTTRLTVAERPVTSLDTSPPEPASAGIGHAATTEELTRPTEVDSTPMSQQAKESGAPAPFPDLDKR